MPKEVIIPALGESISSGILSSWKVADGSYVQLDQPIYELETDKITQEGLAEESGVISILVQEGEEVEIGASVASIDETAEKPDTESNKVPESLEGETVPEEKSVEVAESQKNSALESKLATPVSQSMPTTSTVNEESARHSPAVRKLIKESGIDSKIIKGSGKDGRVTKADVLEAEKEVRKTPPAKPSLIQGTSQESNYTRRPMSPIRKRIAARLVEAQQTAAILSTFNEVDMSAVMKLRKIHQDAFIKQHGIKLGFMSFFIKAVVHGLQAVPGINVRIEGDELVENHYYDISVAVGTEKGLVVPVVRKCDQLSFAEIEQSIIGYAEKARSGAITLEDMQGGCFTITNGGIYGSMLSTPIINPPQSGILGMHTIQERPVVRNGEIVIRPMMFLALSYDHRVVDGKEAVTFLVKIKEAIEDPARLALGV
ncbi:MAG: dihydrolipoyllysine-residue succinyltransferase [Opitutae bacterium]|nr:dihydrolipoyllysine-residue succinyltransferase [Opitutae bacterium]